MNSVETDANGAVDPLQAMNKVLEEYPDGGEEFEELITPVEKHLRNEIRKRNARILFKVSCSTALALVTIFAIVTYTPVYSHLRAISRIGLIKVKILNYIILIIIISKLNTIWTRLGKRR